jgi:hypothetical protein
MSSRFTSRVDIEATKIESAVLKTSEATLDIQALEVLSRSWGTIRAALDEVPRENGDLIWLHATRQFSSGGKVPLIDLSVKSLVAGGCYDLVQEDSPQNRSGELIFTDVSYSVMRIWDGFSQAVIRDSRRQSRSPVDPATNEKTWRHLWGASLESIDCWWNFVKRNSTTRPKDPFFYSEAAASFNELTTRVVYGSNGKTIIEATNHPSLFVVRRYLYMESNAS